MKTIIKHLKHTVIGLGMLLTIIISILAVGLPLVWLGNHYPYIILGLVLIATCWFVGWCRAC